MSQGTPSGEERGQRPSSKCWQGRRGASVVKHRGGELLPMQHIDRLLDRKDLELFSAVSVYYKKWKLPAG